MRHLILASQSPHRLKLLRDAGYDVEVIPVNVTEPDLTDFADLGAGLIHIAALKARAAWRAGAQGLIFAADTVGCAAGQVFGKAANRAEALRMLQAISGTRHEVATGWCLLRTRDQLHLSGVERTTITMRAWTPEEFARYLDSGKWIGKSGAYGLELPHDPFITKITGSASNVIGVPLQRLGEALAEWVTAGGDR